MQQSLRKVLVGGSIAALVLGAGYLYAVRGEAILMDLAAIGTLLCL